MSKHSHLETKSRPSKPTTAKSPAKKSTVYIEQNRPSKGLTTAEASALIATEERNRVLDAEEQAALRELAEEPVRYHPGQARHNASKNTLIYCAMKGDRGELEKWCDNSPIFNESLPYTGDRDVDQERKRLVNDAVMWAGERSHYANLRFLIQNYGEDINWQTTFSDKRDRTAAEYAVLMGQLDSALYMIRNGCPLELPHFGLPDEKQRYLQHADTLPNMKPDLGVNTQEILIYETGLHVATLNAMHALDLFPEIDKYACDEPGEKIYWPWQCNRSLRMMIFRYLLQAVVGYPEPAGAVHPFYYKSRQEQWNGPRV